MALDTVADYLSMARTLLQDEVDSPYRYTDTELCLNLSAAFLEVRRLRPDAVASYFRTSLPSFSAATPSASVPMDEQYRLALVYYIVGMAQLRDDEGTTDARATVFLNKFVSQFLTIAS